MRRAYDAPGSFDRLLEAAIAVAEADTDDDVGFKARCQRLRNAALAYAAARPRHDDAADCRPTVPADAPVTETSG